jgi:hypothetical protein
LPLGKTAYSFHRFTSRFREAGSGDSKLAASYWSSFWLRGADAWERP